MSKSKKQRKALIRKGSELSVVRQCELLDIHRSGVYYEPRGESAQNLELMRLIDQKNLLHPWLGVPRIVKWLQKDMGHAINKKRIERLFRLMGLSATGPKPNTSKRGKGELHRTYKYLLKGLKIERFGQVWAMDITYIPVQGGYLYLCAIIDCGRLVAIEHHDIRVVQKDPGDSDRRTRCARDPQHRPGRPVHGPGVR